MHDLLTHATNVAVSHSMSNTPALPGWCCEKDNPPHAWIKLTNTAAQRSSDHATHAESKHEVFDTPCMTEHSTNDYWQMQISRNMTSHAAASHIVTSVLSLAFCTACCSAFWAAACTSAAWRVRSISRCACRTISKSVRKTQKTVFFLPERICLILHGCYGAATAQSKQGELLDISAHAIDHRGLLMLSKLERWGHSAAPTHIMSQLSTCAVCSRWRAWVTCLARRITCCYSQNCQVQLHSLEGFVCAKQS